MISLRNIYKAFLLLCLLCITLVDGGLASIDDVLQRRVARTRLLPDPNPQKSLLLGERLFQKDQLDEADEYLRNLPTVDLSAEYMHIDDLGIGGCGKVYLMGHRGSKVAVKVIKTDNKKIYPSIANEIMIMKDIPDCPNLVKAIDAFKVKGKQEVAIVMRYIDGADMLDYIEEFCDSRPLKEVDVIPLIRDVLNALYVLHSNGVFHLDIKIENIVYDMANDRYVVIDYGLSSGIGMEGHRQGTTLYISPEMARAGLKKQALSYTASMDLFSLGTTIVILMEGEHHPITLLNDEIKEMKFVLEGRMWPSKPQLYSHLLLDFLGSLLSMNPEDRKNVEYYLNHPLLTGVVEPAVINVVDPAVTQAEKPSSFIGSFLSKFGINY